MADDATTRRFDPDDQPTTRGLSAGRQVFGRYVLVGEVGRGGMGVVWRARDEELEREIALKFLPEVVAGDAEALRDLKRETKRCLELTHPHIVRVYDFVAEAPTAAIAMELINGESLGRRKARAADGCLPVGELAPLVVQLCEALDYAHWHAKVVHRDLKPANLLVTKEGQLKVSDFGIARSLSDTHTRLTGRVGNTSGTLAFMSPQQMLGGDPAASDDIYALGATLYDLLSGKPPFHSGDLPSQIRDVLPKPLNERRAAAGLPPVPKVWEDTVGACLSKDPKQRPRSAGEVARRLGLAEGSAALPLESEPEIAGAVPPPKASPRPTTPTSKRKRPRWWLPAAIAAAAVVLVAAGLLFFRKSPAARKSVLPASASPMATSLGGLIVTTSPPGAQVTVGGIAADQSPLTLKDVRPGSYPVVIRMSGYEEATRRADIKANQFATLAVTLERSTGTLVVTSSPEGLRFDLGSAFAGGNGSNRELTTPGTLKVPTGTYTLTFHRTGWPDQQKRVTVARNETTPVAIEYAGGALSVTSHPSGAKVYLGGKLLGETPLNLTDAAPGDHLLEVRLGGYGRATATARVRVGQTATVDVPLKLIGPPAGKPWTVPDVGLVLQPIPAGTFTMGSPADEAGRSDDEGPQTQVTFSEPFWLGRTEVTQAQWNAIMDSNPSYFKGQTLPVESVSWKDAMTYCRRLTDQERAAGRLPQGYVYTLPTEAEWEYACRAGTTGPYAGDGNLNDLGWHNGNSGGWTHPVAQKQPNGWGLYDMYGNLAEWCRDWYGPYPGGSVTDYAGPSSGTGRVVRGGSWSSDALSCRSASRGKSEPPDYSDNTIGFRVALVPSSSP